MVTARKPVLPATMAVEFACDRRCQVEIDCDDVDGRATVTTLRRAAAEAHEAAHRAESPQRHYRAAKHIVVRAGRLPVLTRTKES